MIKINTKIPKEILLRAKWHHKIEVDSGIQNLPYRYNVSKTVIQGNSKHISSTEVFFSSGHKFYKCTSVDGEQKVELYIHECILQYMSGDEVPDCNPGLYFSDYLPSENSIIMIQGTDRCTPFKVTTELIKGQNDTLIFAFRLKGIIFEANPVLYPTDEWKWKYIFVDDIPKMIKAENAISKQALDLAVYMDMEEEMIQDTIIHKEIVSFVMNKFADYMETEREEHSIAEKLRECAIVHDNSKLLNEVEFMALTSIINDKSCLKDSSAELSAYKQDAIELHWKNNGHHPEHYEDIRQMPVLCRMEFACDCKARSIQYGTEFLPFMETRQEKRFRFPDDIWDEIFGYCKILENIC